MHTDIQTLIEKRPHLKDPLEFYALWQRFHQQTTQLHPFTGRTPDSDNSRSYQHEHADQVMQLFISTFNLSEQNIKPIRSALAAGQLDFMRFPLDETPDLDLPGGKDELTTILYLFSRPYFLNLRESCLLDGHRWEDGRCPLCSAKPAMASLTDDPQRILHCSWCTTSGPYRFTGCPHCGISDPSKLGTLVPEEEKGFKVVTCNECKTYLKVVESPVLAEMSIDLADLASLPLDIVAQEKGYARRAPNPIGLRKML